MTVAGRRSIFAAMLALALLSGTASRAQTTPVDGIEISRMPAAAAPMPAPDSTSGPASAPAASDVIRRSNANSPAAPSPAAPMVPDTIRVVLALSAVLALILILRWGGKRLMAAGAFGRGPRGVQVLGRTHLSPRQQVVILQVGRRLLVVGDSGGQLNTLCEISDPDEAAMLIAQVRGEARPEPPPQTAFSTVFRRASARFRGGEEEAGAPAHEPSVEDADPQLASARQELNGLAERVRSVARHLRKA